MQLIWTHGIAVWGKLSEHFQILPGKPVVRRSSSVLLLWPPWLANDRTLSGIIEASDMSKMEPLGLLLWNRHGHKYNFLHGEVWPDLTASMHYCYLGLVSSVNHANLTPVSRCLLHFHYHNLGRSLWTWARYQWPLRHRELLPTLTTRRGRSSRFTPSVLQCVHPQPLYYFFDCIRVSTF